MQWILKSSLEYRYDITACICEPFLLGGDNLKPSVKVKFDRKMRLCYDAYRTVWLGKSNRELIADADEIAIITQIMQNLPDIQYEDAMSYLLTFQNPLGVMADYWQSAIEAKFPFIGEQMRSIL